MNIIIFIFILLYVKNKKYKFIYFFKLYNFNNIFFNYKKYVIISLKEKKNDFLHLKLANLKLKSINLYILIEIL